MPVFEMVYLVGTPVSGPIEVMASSGFVDLPPSVVVWIGDKALWH